MAQDFESNGAQITNSATTIYTSNSDDAVVGLRLANILTTTVTVSVFVSEGGSTTRSVSYTHLTLPTILLV